METRIHEVTGAGGVGLHVREIGPEDAPPILLIHGWSQFCGCWEAQAPLAATHRLVSYDLRGHGASDKPEDPAAYAEAAPWGGDVAAIIAALALDRPVLVGWSYGSRSVASYLEQHGSDALAGIVLVGGVLAIGSAREPWMAGPGSPGSERDLYTADLPRRLAATARFVEACTPAPLERLLFARMVGANMLCPAHVRRAMFAGDHDLRPAYAELARPGLVIQGAQDDVVTLAVGETAAQIMPKGRFSVYERVGHVPFLEDPDLFNADLAAFVQEARAT
ncbi:MAG: alpha/beta hydrolase [Pseudomonadota bacterium]